MLVETSAGERQANPEAACIECHDGIADSTLAYLAAVPREHELLSIRVSYAGTKGYRRNGENKEWKNDGVREKEGEREGERGEGRRARSAAGRGKASKSLLRDYFSVISRD